MELVRPEVTEVCSGCNNENTIIWDCEQDGYVAYCPHCGEKMMLCDACRHADDNPKMFCDWCTESGCWRELAAKLKSVMKVKAEYEKEQERKCYE